MKFFHQTIGLLAASLALTPGTTHAQLLLSGQTTGEFVDLAEANTTITNAPDGSSAKFSTGIPLAGSVQSSIAFTNVNFAALASGDPVQVGLFKITNGLTKVGSGAHFGRFNLGLQITSPENFSIPIGTFDFHIDHTPNVGGALIPDLFSVTFSQPPPVLIKNTVVRFTVRVDPVQFVVSENSTVTKGDIAVEFSPIPEPATFAVWGAALLIGLFAYRRLRGERDILSAFQT